MIRAATEADVPALIEMGRRFHDATPYVGIVTFNEAEFERSLLGMMDAAAALLRVLDNGSGPVGMIGAVSGRHFISGETAVWECFWWVDPQHRGRGALLLTAFEEWSWAIGATLVCTSLLASDDRTKHLYERRGYRMGEVGFVKGI